MYSRHLLLGAAGIGTVMDWSPCNYSYVPYEGGMVYITTPGIYKDVSILDFTSMYPSIMGAAGISPENITVVGHQHPVSKYGAVWCDGVYVLVSPVPGCVMRFEMGKGVLSGMFFTQTFKSLL